MAQGRPHGGGRRPPAPAWTVRIRAHRCERFEIPAQLIEVCTTSVDVARLAGIREAHRRGRLPPWKPLLRISWPHTTAERVGATPTAPTAIDGERVQLTLDELRRAA